MNPFAKMGESRRIVIVSAVRVLPITCVNAHLEYLVLITEHISCLINFDSGIFTPHCVNNFIGDIWEFC